MSPARRAEWRKGCEQEFRKAIALHPNYAFAHDQLAMALAFVGRYDESIALSRTTPKCSPGSDTLFDVFAGRSALSKFAKAPELRG